MALLQQIQTGLNNFGNTLKTAWNSGDGQQGLLGNLMTGNNQRLNNVGAMGVTAKSPTDNIAAPSNTLPQSYVTNHQPGSLASGLYGGKIPLVGNSFAKPMSTPSTPTPAPQGLQNNPIQTQINSLQGKVTAAQNAGYGANDQIQYDAQGNVIPKNNTLPPGAGYTPQYNSPNNQPTVGSIASQEANILNNPSPQVQQAQQELQALKNEYAQKGINIQNTAGFLTQAEGEQGQLQNQYLTALDAAQTKLQNALNSQSQGITALGQAGSQVAPVSQAPGTSVYNPATGSYNPTIAGNQGGAGGLQGIGNIAGQIVIGQTQATLNASLGQAQTTAADLQNVISQGNINPTSFPPINQLVQWFNSGVVSGTGNEKYQEFVGEMNDFINKMAPILTGGSTTNMANEMASAMINAYASGQSISDVINHYLTLAKSNVQAYGQGGGAGVGSQPSSGTVFSHTNFYGQ